MDSSITQINFEVPSMYYWLMNFIIIFSKIMVYVSLCMCLLFLIMLILYYNFIMCPINRYKKYQ